jgi:hypothetical protein
MMERVSSTMLKISIEKYQRLSQLVIRILTNEIFLACAYFEAHEARHSGGYSKGAKAERESNSSGSLEGIPTEQRNGK